MNKTKALIAALLAVVGWTVIFFTVLGWWAIHTAGERAVGPLGLMTIEVERTAPTLLYFFIVGLLLGRLLGPRAGGTWALAASAVAMSIHALLTQRVLFSIDSLAVGLLAIDYLLPPVAAVAGAVTSRLWRSAGGGAEPT